MHRLQLRWTEFGTLVSTDRLTCSFLVDFVFLAGLQGWLVSADIERREDGTIATSEGEEGVGGDKLADLGNVARYIPFFGLVYYFFYRPPLPTKSD